MVDLAYSVMFSYIQIQNPAIPIGCSGWPRLRVGRAALDTGFFHLQR